MPSASVKLEKQGSQEILDPFHKVMNLVEKKIRNLEKRKNKLEQYRMDLEAGKQLNNDQQQAVANYDCVLANLELMREMIQQFGTILTDHGKHMKKQMKREQLEKQQEEINKVKEILKVQEVLQQMGQEEARADFIAGTNGAAQIPAESLDGLDVLYKLVTPVRTEGQTAQDFQNDIRRAAEHMVWLLEGRNKEIATAATTYKALQNVVDEIASCSYPESKPVEVEEEAVPSAEPIEEVTEYTNGLVAEETEEIAQVSEVLVTSPVTEGPPPPGLAPPTVAPMLSPSLPQEPVAVNPAQEALVAAMAQMTTATVPGTPPQGAGMPPAPSYYTQAPPQPTPQPQPPQPAPQQQQPPQQAPLQPPPPPQLQPISLNDLVSPGSFDFLQESQVAQEPPTVYMDPAVVSIGSIKTDSVSQRPVSPVAQQSQQVAPLVAPSQDPTHPSNIPTQTYTNQTYNVVSYSQGVPVYTNTVVDSTPNPPPPIPLPPQARPQDKVEFNPEASPWTGQPVPAQQQQTGPTISNVQQQEQEQQEQQQPPPPPPPEADNWGTPEIPVNGGDDRWGSDGNWDEYEDSQGNAAASAPPNGHGDYERRGGFRGRGRGGFGGRGGFRGGRGGFQNGRGGYGGYGGFRGGRSGMGGPRGGRGFRGQGPRGNFRGRGGGYQGQRSPYQQQQHQQQ